MPKSSTAICTPSSFSARSIPWIWVSRRSSTVSVSSSCSDPGASPGVRRASPTWSTNPASRNCRAETLTLTYGAAAGPGSRCRAEMSLTAFSSTHEPSVPMCPVSSASEMNCSGGMGLCGACGQRTSASKPTTSPALMSTTGW